MRIILNFLPLKTGGGVQVALDFLKQAELYGQGYEWHLVARKGTPFEAFDRFSYIKSSVFVSDNIASRLKFEIFSCVLLIKKIKPDVVYTQFGPQWIAGFGVKNVVGCAYSNLFYPEIDFWRNYSKIKKIERRLFDFYRKIRLKSADYVVFETSDLAKRSVDQSFLKKNKVSFVLPAVSSNVHSEAEHREVREALYASPKGFRLCLISGYSINKNFEILVDVLSILKNKFQRTDFYFVFTLSATNNHVKRLLADARDKGVLNNIINIGVIPFDACAEVYKACDAAILPATLESFSNNIAESWGMSIPLIISDMDWARSLCGDGAIYINQSCAGDIANKIIALQSSPQLTKEVVESGLDRLSDYPTSKGRFSGYMEILDRVVNKHA